MYEFWCYYVKPEYDKYAKRCYMNTVSFTAYIKIDDIYKDIAEDVEAGFDTWNFELDRPLPTGENKKVIGLMKDELYRQIIKELVVDLIYKTYSYVKENWSKKHKKVYYERKT